MYIGIYIHTHTHMPIYSVNLYIGIHIYVHTYIHTYPLVHTDTYKYVSIVLYEKEDQPVWVYYLLTTYRIVIKPPSKENKIVCISFHEIGRGNTKLQQAAP